MSHWYRDLLTDPGHLGSWAARLLADEPAARESAWREAPWPWPDEMPECYREQCRSIRTALLARQPLPQIILLTSPEPEAGVSALARGLASACAALPSKSCLLVPAASLGGLLENNFRLDEVINRSADLPHLCWIDAAENEAPLADLLSGAEWDWVCAQARLQFDWIILDGIPASEGAAFDLLARAADVVALIARTGHSTHPALAGAIRRIEPGKLAGIVLNG